MAVMAMATGARDPTGLPQVQDRLPAALPRVQGHPLEVLAVTGPLQEQDLPMEPVPVPPTGLPRLRVLPIQTLETGQILQMPAVTGAAAVVSAEAGATAEAGVVAVV